MVSTSTRSQDQTHPLSIRVRTPGRTVRSPSLDSYLLCPGSSTSRSPAVESYLHRRLASQERRVARGTAICPYIDGWGALAGRRSIPTLCSVSSQKSACLREYVSSSTHKPALNRPTTWTGRNSLGGRNYVPTLSSGALPWIFDCAHSISRPPHRIARRTIIRPYSAMSAPHYMISRRSNSLGPTRRTTIRTYFVWPRLCQCVLTKICMPW